MATSKRQVRELYLGAGQSQEKNKQNNSVEQSVVLV